MNKNSSFKHNIIIKFMNKSSSFKHKMTIPIWNNKKIIKKNKNHISILLGILRVWKNYIQSKKKWHSPESLHAAKDVSLLLGFLFSYSFSLI